MERCNPESPHRLLHSVPMRLGCIAIDKDLAILRSLRPIHINGKWAISPKSLADVHGALLCRILTILVIAILRPVGQLVRGV